MTPAPLDLDGRCPESQSPCGREPDAGGANLRAPEVGTPAAQERGYVFATVPDGTPVRVLSREGPNALIETPGPAGHFRRCRVSSERADELEGQAQPAQLREFRWRSQRSERIGRERWRDHMLTQARRAPRARQARAAAPRRRGSRRATLSRAGPSDDPGPGEPEPSSRRHPSHDLSGKPGRLRPAPLGAW